MPAPDRVGQVQTFSNVINPTKGIVGHYSDLEIDALLAGLSGGTLQTVDLSAYATTAYVDGELQKVYDKAAVDAAIAAAISGLAPPDLSGLATEQFVTDAIAAAPSTQVFEQDTQPATGKDGDLWLHTPAATSDSVEAAIRADADTTELDAHVTALVRKLMTGGKEPPPDLDWAVCPKVAGSGTVEAKLMNGVVYLRGECVITTSTFTKIRTLPPGFPAPSGGARVLTPAAEAGVAERVCQIIVSPTGDLSMSTLGAKITVCYFNCSFPVV